MSNTRNLREQFLQRLSALPECITFQQIADVTLRDVDAVRRWRTWLGFPPEVDRNGPRGAQRFNREKFALFYIEAKLLADEAGTAPGPKAADALGQIPEIAGLRLTAADISSLRKVSLGAVHKAAASSGFPKPISVRIEWQAAKRGDFASAWNMWKSLKEYLDGVRSGAASTGELLKLGIGEETLADFVEEGLLERKRETRYRLTPEGRRNSPRMGTAQHLAWERLKDCYPQSLHVDEILKGGISRTNFAAMVARGDAELDTAITYRLTENGRENDLAKGNYRETYIRGPYEYDAAEVARYFRGVPQSGDQRLGPLTTHHLERWAREVGDTCTRAEIAHAARRSDGWVATRLKGKGAPEPVGRRRLTVGRTAYEYDTRRIVDWLKEQFSIED
ncbi:hypothetical protein [Streptomyces sp. NPDC001165]|uniref:hypothetical protein n=1 Tax=Streptomyces sp. NPDC001165 TaxID=3364546 RepID=UPI0036B951F3